jgi:hypothetical protein
MMVTIVANATNVTINANEGNRDPIHKLDGMAE